VPTERLRIVILLNTHSNAGVLHPTPFTGLASTTTMSYVFSKRQNGKLFLEKEVESRSVDAIGRESSSSLQAQPRQGRRTTHSSPTVALTPSPSISKASRIPSDIRCKRNFTELHLHKRQVTVD
jgi:hypothetical protein